jgi:hypothetical protein
MERYLFKHPDRRVHVTEFNVLVIPDEKNAQGRAYEGCGVRPEFIIAHKEAWHKVVSAVSQDVRLPS